MTEFLRIGCLVIGAIPLIAYPFIMLASLMGLAGRSTVKVPMLCIVMNAFFLWGTLAYPLVYGLMYYLSGRHREEAGLMYASFPLIFIGLLYISSHFMDWKGPNQN